MPSPTSIMTPTQTAPVQEGLQALSKRSWWWHFGLFSISVIFPSLALFKKLGWAPLIGYVGASSLGLFLTFRYLLPWFSHRLTTRVCIAGVVALLAGLAAAHCWIYPQILQDGGFKLFGIQFGLSDSNDAFVATWRAMLKGHYPYYAKSFLGNPISPMPGALLVAFPFYVLKLTSLQNVFWLGTAWAALGCYKNFRTSSILLLTVLAFCPNISYQLVVAGDYVTNAIYVLLPALGVLLFAGRQDSKKLSFWFAVCLGIAASSRANFLLILPALFFAMNRLSGLKSALLHFGVISITFAAVTLPFFLYDPAGFSPLHTTGKLEVQGGLPHAAQIFFFAGLLLSSILGFFRNVGGNPEKMSGTFFFVQAFVIYGAFLTTSLAIRAPAMWYPHFALMCLPFGAFAFGPALVRDALNASKV